MKFESGVGFSYGCDGVGVHEAAAVRAEHLDRHLRGHGALRDGLGVDPALLHHRVALGVFDDVAVVVFFRNLDGVGVEDPGRVVGLEVLNHALGHQEHGVDDAQGQENVKIHPHEVHPEVADGLGGLPGNAAHQGGCYGYPHGGGSEVVKRQPHHLGQIGGGGFPAVALPVGVGREAHRRVERQVVAKRTQPLRVQRQQVLQPQNRVGEKNAHQAERQHGNGVLLPALLLLGVHSQEKIQGSFHRPQHRVQERPPLPVQHLEEINARRAGQHQQKAHEQCQLEPPESVVENLHGQNLSGLMTEINK